MTAYRVYILRNSTSRFYIGLSDDAQRRLKQHNGGMSKWTKAGRPWQIVWQSAALPLGEARRLENKLKRQKGGDGLFRMTGLDREAGS